MPLPPTFIKFPRDFLDVKVNLFNFTSSDMIMIAILFNTASSPVIVNAFVIYKHSRSALNCPLNINSSNSTSSLRIPSSSKKSSKLLGVTTFSAASFALTTYDVWFPQPVDENKLFPAILVFSAFNSDLEILS